MLLLNNSGTLNEQVATTSQKHCSVIARTTCVVLSYTKTNAQFEFRLCILLYPEIIWIGLEEKIKDFIWMTSSQVNEHDRPNQTFSRLNRALLWTEQRSCLKQIRKYNRCPLAPVPKAIHSTERRKVPLPFSISNRAPVVHQDTAGTTIFYCVEAKISIFLNIEQYSNKKEAITEASFEWSCNYPNLFSYNFRI